MFYESSIKGLLLLEFELNNVTKSICYKFLRMKCDEKCVVMISQNHAKLTTRIEFSRTIFLKHTIFAVCLWLQFHIKKFSDLAPISISTAFIITLMRHIIFSVIPKGLIRNSEFIQILHIACSQFCSINVD